MQYFSISKCIRHANAISLRDVVDAMLVTLSLPMARGNDHIRAYLSFNQYKSLEIV